MILSNIVSIWVIFKKELKSIFTSPWFLFIYAMFSLLLAVRYLLAIDEFIQRTMMPQAGGVNIHDAVFIPHLNWVYMTFLVLVPLLAMKLISEEKKERTMDLLLTSPVTSLDIVLGKFFAIWFVLITMIGLALLFPLATSLVSSFDWGPLWGSYLGMIFLAGFNLSLCLFASSLTSSTVMSGFLGFLFILVTMIFGSTGIESQNIVLASIYEQLSLGSHLRDFFLGVLNIKSFVFLVSGMGFFCYLSYKMVENLRWK